MRTIEVGISLDCYGTVCVSETIKLGFKIEGEGGGGGVDAEVW